MLTTSTSSFKNTFGLFIDNSFHVDKLFKKLALRLENQLSTSDYKTVLGSYPSRWQTWNNSLASLHFIYRKRFSPFSVTIMNIIPMNVPVWRMAIQFLYRLSNKRHPKVLFVGNSKFFPLSTLVHDKLYKEFDLHYIRAVDHWIPGFAGNIRSMFLPYTPLKKGNIRDVRGVRLSNVRNYRGQHYQKPIEFETHKFMYNFFYPECFVFLNSTGRAHNADKEVYNKSIPTLALCSTDTKSFAFSGCFFTLPAGVNYEDHLYYYVFMFYVVIAYARSNFLYKEYLSLKPTVFKPVKKTSSVYDTNSNKFLLKRFVEKYQKFLYFFNKNIRYKEYLQIVDEDSELLNDDESVLLRKWNRWSLPKEIATEKQAYKSLMFYRALPGREAIITSEHSKRNETQRLFDRMYENLNTIGYAFKTIISVVLLQHLYTRGATFIKRSPQFLENNIVLFHDSPGCRLLKSILSCVGVGKKEKNDKGGSSVPFILASKNILFFNSLLQYKNFVFSTISKSLRGKKTINLQQQNVRATAVNSLKGKVIGNTFKKGIPYSVSSLLGLINLKFAVRSPKINTLNRVQQVERKYQKDLRRFKIEEHRKKRNFGAVSTQQQKVEKDSWDSLPNYIREHDKKNVVFHTSRKKSKF